MTTIRTRNEYFLGQVFMLCLDDDMTTIELRVDGWHRLTDHSDGYVLTHTTHTASSIRKALDAAPEHANTIAAAHLAYVNALKIGGETAKARVQRAALVDALKRHGYSLAA